MPSFTFEDANGKICQQQFRFAQTRKSGRRFLSRRVVSVLQSLFEEIAGKYFADKSARRKSRGDFGGKSRHISVRRQKNKVEFYCFERSEIEHGAKIRHCLSTRPETNEKYKVSVLIGQNKTKRKRRNCRFRRHISSIKKVKSLTLFSNPITKNAPNQQIIIETLSKINQAIK